MHPKAPLPLGLVPRTADFLRELYERLKARKVLVVPGSYFFFGHGDPDWRHSDGYLRINYTMPEADIKEGLRIIGEEVAKAYAANRS